MTNDEAMTIIARMASAWHQVDLTEPTVEIWREHLITRRFDVALDVIRGLEEGVNWFPSINLFSENYSIGLRKVIEFERNERRGLMPAPDEPTRDVRDLIHGLKAELESIGQHRNHTKAGGDDCPVCGPVIREEPGHHIRAGDPEHGTWRDCPECVKEMAERGLSV